MKPIKIRSGGEAFALEPGETCPPGAVCFFPGEWELALRMGKAAASDPQNTFWKDLIETKRSLPGYTLFSDSVKTKKPEQLSLQDLGIQSKSMSEREKEREKCLRIARETIEMLGARLKEKAGK